MVSISQSPMMARAWRKILPLAAILAFELVSHVLIISPCPALAIENGEGQSLVDPQLQPADFENEEGQRTDNLGEAASESQQLILREGVESSTPSLRGTTVLRELGEKELGGDGSGQNFQEDPNAMTGQGGRKNKQRYISTAMAMPSAAMAMPSAAMAMPSAAVAMPSATFAVPSATYAVPSATYAVPSTTYAVPSTTYAVPSTTYAVPSATYAVPSATYAAPSATYAVPSSTYSVQSTTVAMPSSTFAMPSSAVSVSSSAVAMPASTLTVPYATMSVPAVAATPMTTGVIADGAVGGGLFQKMKTLKSYLGLMKYAKYANVAGYNTYGTFSNAYPMVADYGPAAATFASVPSKGYNGYNTYAGNNNYMGFSAPTENIGGLGKKTRFTEEPGQRYLAQVLSKNRTGWWLSNKVSKLVDILGGVLPQGVDQPALLSNGYETREAVFLAVLQNRERFVDLLVQDQLLQEEQPLQRQWIGRMYTEVKGQYSAIQALDRDFTIAKMAPQNQPLASFRHSLRLDIPIDLYEFSGLDTYVQAPDGQVFLNAISRRPLIRATAETVMANAGSSRRAYKALLSLSQQAVRAVANLNCIMMVHTNINPASFLVTEKGLVFLGGLFQATQQGSSLANNYKFTLTTPVFLPPELRDNASYYSMQALPSQDAWQLGMTLFTFWCSQLTVDSAGGLNFSNCISCMPAEIKDLIMGLTQIDPNSRLLAENVALKHPAMLLPIYPDIPPQADVNQDDEPYLDFF